MISSVPSSWSKPIVEISYEKFRGTRKNWPSMAIFSNDLLHGTVHHPTKFQANSWKPLRVKAVTSSLGPSPSLFWKFLSSVERVNFCWAGPFYIAICFIILCIIPPNCRPIAEILKEAEREHGSGRTDGQTDGWTDWRPDAMTDDNTRPRVKLFDN